MNKDAKKVFQGKLFSVWQWEQQMFDGSAQTFEMVQRPNTSQVIAVVGDKILMQQEQQPQMPKPIPSIPGGRFDEGEDPLTAVQRELLEETGYTSTDWVLWHQIRPVFKMDWTVYTYVARRCVIEKEQELDDGERIKTNFVSFDEFLEIATEDDDFYSPEITIELLRMRLHPEKKEAFRKLLFG